MSDRLDPGLIGFRFMTEDDLPRMHRWLNEGEALRWYGQKPTTLEEVTREYAPKLHGRGDLLAMIITYDGAAIGYIQRYFTRDEEEYWGHQHFPDDTAGIDLLIGEPAFQHRGLGPHVIRTFLKQHVFADGTTARCIIDPDPANVIAIRAYEKVGFRYLRTLQPPDHIEPAYLMALERSDLEQPGS